MWSWVGDRKRHPDYKVGAGLLRKVYGSPWCEHVLDARPSGNWAGDWGTEVTAPEQALRQGGLVLKGRCLTRDTPEAS